MNVLQSLTRKALDFDPDQQAIEWRGEWFTWDQLRTVADRTAELLARTGAGPRAPVALFGQTLHTQLTPEKMAALLRGET